MYVAAGTAGATIKLDGMDGATTNLITIVAAKKPNLPQRHALKLNNATTFVALGLKSHVDIVAATLKEK